MRNVRVVEVDPDLAGAYCGRLFAGTGAEVVCAEPDSGTRLRGEGEGYLWEYLAVGKSSVVLDGGVRGVTADEPSGVGSLELFANRPRATALEAVEPTIALRIGKEMLYDLVEDHHAASSPRGCDSP